MSEIIVITGDSYEDAKNLLPKGRRIGESFKIHDLTHDAEVPEYIDLDAATKRYSLEPGKFHIVYRRP